MRYCVKCGRQVEDSMNFCPSCGAQIPKEETHHTYEYGNGQYTQNQTEQKPLRRRGQTECWQCLHIWDCWCLCRFCREVNQNLSDSMRTRDLCFLSVVYCGMHVEAKKKNYRLSGTLFCSNKRKRVRGAGQPLYRLSA